MANDKDIRAKLIMKMRRDLIATLKLWYPAAPSYGDIRLTLPEIEDRYLRGDLRYLMDKQHVEWINERANMAWEEREFRLTPLGVEQADGIENDPAFGP